MKKHFLLLSYLFLAFVFQNSCSTMPYWYDPYGYGYDAMQSVIDYRWDAMDWSNDAWDAYIRE